jgi:uncharacterized membrane protein
MAKKPLMLSIFIVAVMLVVSLWAWNAIPGDRIATHYGLSGEPNGFMPKPLGLLVLPALGLIISLFMASLPQWPLLGSRIKNSTVPYVANWVGGVAILGCVHVVLILKDVGYNVDIVRSVCLLIGALFLVTGNYYGKIRYNYVFGFKTPWTLSSERVWDKTHRLLGRLMVLSALGLILTVLLSPSTVMVGLLMTFFILAPMAVGLVYSAAIARANA